MRPLSRLALAASLAIGLACGEGRAPEPADALEPALVLDDEQGRTWNRLWEEQQAMTLLVELSEEWRPSRDGGTLVVEGATVIPMTGAPPLEDQTVRVEGGRFSELGERRESDPDDSTLRIDGEGLFLIPGLVESHSHTISSPSQFLVYLSRGVTTLREMDGFPWMLDARALAARNQLLVPNLYLAGHILSHRPWDFYMTGVESQEDARRLVGEQVAAGYDFIKVHNSMPEPLFGEILRAAAEAGVDVAGHIPNEIPIAAAIAAGFRTNEHFKGYIFDETLQITEQPYVEDTGGSELWNTPTFTTYHDHLRGDASRELVEREGSLELVPRWMRSMWHRQSEGEVDRLTELRQTIYPKSKEIFVNLTAVTDRFLAGTDTGTYAYLVPGYALQEEVRIFEELGLSPAAALSTATVNPARAFRQEDEFGTVEVGKRADFVLLEKNPLESTEHLSEIAGVSVRGIFLGRDRLRTIRTRLAEVFADETPILAPSREALGAWVEQARALRESGWPYPAYTVSEMRELLEALGLEALSATLVSPN